MEAEFKERSETAEAATYDLRLLPADARAGASRILSRNGKRLEVKVPAGTGAGQVVRLRNALRVTDGRDGDILIRLEYALGATEGDVVAVTDATFEAEVLKADVPVLVDFWAVWCGPCRALAPVVERLAKEYQGRVRFRKLNVDENPLASRKYQVVSIPSVLIFKNGRIAGVSVGAVSENELRGRIDAALPVRQ
ncbi:MAG: thioredoxin [Dehalococcoidia bacterium]|nr:thioredoxin [Dehalococcoidia bacterium]